MTKELSFEHKRFTGISDNCKDLMSKLLDRCVETRITANKALQHPFFEVLQEVQKTSLNVKPKLRKTET